MPDWVSIEGIFNRHVIVGKRREAKGKTAA